MLSFDGVDDYVEVADSVSLDSIASGFAVMWVKARVVGDRDYVFWKEDDQRGIRMYNTGIFFKWQFAVHPNDADCCTLSTSNILIETWTLLTISWDGLEFYYYINSGLESLNDWTPLFVSGGQTLMVRDGGGRYLNGLIDEVVVYNRTLSQTEIQSYYNRLVP